MNGVKSALRQFGAWARVSGFSWMVCAVLFLADEGTIGRLWANRQAAGYESVGYIVAVGLDLSAALALDRMAHAKLRKHKVLASVVFGLACGVSAFFGVQYYREYAPSDPVMLSVAMGCVCPVLAASIALLRGMTMAHENELQIARQMQEAEARRVADLELRKFEIAQVQATVLQVAKETTKQTRAKSRATQAKMDLEREKAENAQKVADVAHRTAEETERIDGALQRLGKAGEILRIYLTDPASKTADVAQSIGVTRQTVTYHLDKLERDGVIRKNGSGVELVADLS